MKILSFSNGVSIDSEMIVRVESNQQRVQFPAAIDELEHMLRGRPSSLVIELSDGSVVRINAGKTQLNIQSSGSADDAK